MKWPMTLVILKSEPCRIIFSDLLFFGLVLQTLHDNTRIEIENDIQLQ